MRVVEQEKLAYEGGPYREHFISNLQALRDMLASDYADVIVSVIAETQYNPELRGLFFERFLQPVQAIGDEDLQRAINRGEVKEFVDKDLLFDQLFGLFYYRVLVVHREITDAEIEVIVDAFLKVAGESAGS